ncbi:hypothetical protein B0H13DRAFT_1999471 [Mycena leptocephala]|nr:hypothetical protein B0H13DRAFT_1999471 [Mycena leptocephala]
MIAPRDDSNAFPITEAQLTGIYFETLGYGMYLVTCCFCAQILFWIPQPGGGERLRQRSEIRWLLVSIFCFIFVVSTFDDIIGLLYMILAFVKYRGAGGPKEELTNTHYWINIARSFNQILNMIVSDFVLVYRCFIVYGRRWLAITVSFTLYLTGIAMGVQLMHTEITASNNAITLNTKLISPWWSTFFAITAAQNVLTTSLLVWRIWRIEHQNEKFRAGNTSLSAPAYQPPLRKVIRVVAESGLAYSTLVFLTFVVSVCNSNMLYPLSDATLQATGITFNVIIIRSTSRRDNEFRDFDRTERGVAVQAGRAPSGIQFFSHSTADQRTTIGNINITITSATDRLDDGESQVGDTYSMKDVAAKL